MIPYANILTRFYNIDIWNKENVMEVMRDLADTYTNGKIGKIIQPIRILLTGTTDSIPIDIVIRLLGKDATIKRLKDEKNLSLFRKVK